MKTINKFLISAIHNYNQKEKEIVPALMDLLNLEKQSVYRRLRNEIPFTLKEASILSLNMGFSIDGIINQKSIYSDILPIMQNRKSDLQDQYIETINQFSHLLENIRKDEYATLFSVTNQLPFSYFGFFENIIKMKYYKWKHQRTETLHNLHFSNFLLPVSIISAIKNLNHKYININNQTLILDQNILSSIIKEIIFFYERDLISVDDLELLQNELLQIIDELEVLATNGQHKSGAKINIYLSSLNIETNCTLLENEQNICFRSSFNTDEPLLIFNQLLCYNQKKMLHSLKKYSTLISECNEFSRSRFFQKQRKLIMNIKKESDVYT